jgi:4-amino-4-deoxy-L-arabinose transferase-like glycosyltransferase
MAEARSPTSAQECGASGRRGRALTVGLLVTLGVAAALRLPGLDQAPPGLHQDEAVNAWNAWCLLHTGKDQFGVSWPVFCMRAIGDFRSTLYTYSQIPFQAVGGLNVWTIRLPAAIGGVLTVLLAYVVGRRLFDRPTGLMAAALLAINPTHVQLSRMGLEAAQAPLFILAAIAAVLWAGLPFSDAGGKPQPVRTLVAGLIAGGACYGYPSARLYLPLYLTAAVLVTWRGWWQLPRSRRGASALAGLALGVGVTFGPLAYKHITEPEVIGKRGGTTWIWEEEDPTAVRVGKVLSRYAGHFDPDVMFRTGDQDETFWTVPLGFVPLYTAPLMLAGLIVAVASAHRSRSMRVVLLGVAFYPIADATNFHVSMHALRCASGLWALLLLASVGCVSLIRLLLRYRMRAWALAVGAAVAGTALPETARFLRIYVNERASRVPVYYGTHQDLLEACQWLRPRVDQADLILCFSGGPNPGYTPYLMTLVALQHSPEQWFTEPREIEFGPVWDRTVRYGKFYFLHADERAAMLADLRTDDVEQRVLLLLRPEDEPPCPPAERILGPDGKPTVVICECWL